MESTTAREWMELFKEIAATSSNVRSMFPMAALVNSWRQTAMTDESFQVPQMIPNNFSKIIPTIGTPANQSRIGFMRILLRCGLSCEQPTTAFAVPGVHEHWAFLGRISPERRVDPAIAIAQAIGLPSKIAAKVDRVDQACFEGEIRPLPSSPGFDYIGEINERAKGNFLGNARALLFPIDWPEPFGLVMIEAMACGTPVLAFRHGSVPEVIDEGVTGHVVDSIDEAIPKMGSLLALDRGRVEGIGRSAPTLLRFLPPEVSNGSSSLASSAYAETANLERGTIIVRPARTRPGLNPER